MFEPRENPGFELLVYDARAMLASWLQNEWYESSSSDAKRP